MNVERSCQERFEFNKGREIGKFGLKSFDFIVYSTIQVEILQNHTLFDHLPFAGIAFFGTM